MNKKNTTRKKTITLESRGGAAACFCRGLGQTRSGRCRLHAGPVAGPPQWLGGTAACYPRGAWRVGVVAGCVAGRACCPRGAGCWGAGAHLCLLVGRGELLPPVWVEPPHLPGGGLLPLGPPHPSRGGARAVRPRLGPPRVGGRARPCWAGSSRSPAALWATFIRLNSGVTLELTNNNSSVMLLRGR